jgi:hypothetical protein
MAALDERINKNKKCGMLAVVTTAPNDCTNMHLTAAVQVLC